MVVGIWLSVVIIVEVLETGIKYKKDKKTLL